MGFDSLAGFEAARQTHARQVRRLYEKILGGGEPAKTSPLPGEFAGHEGRWKELLARHQFRDLGQAFRMIEMFVNGPGYVHVSPRSVELARELLPRIFALCPPPSVPHDAASPRLSDPDRVMVRLQSFMEAYGARAMLFEMWTQKPALFDLLLRLFDRSEFLAERAIRNPDLVDELEAGGRLRRQKTAAETLRDLRYGLEDKDQFRWLRRYHEAELMRIGLRDIFGLADFEQNLGGTFRAGRRLPAIRVGSRLPRAPPGRRSLLRHRPGQTGRGRGRLRLGPGRSFRGPVRRKKPARLPVPGRRRDGFARPHHRAWNCFSY